MVGNYSDISREQFEIIRRDLEKAKKATNPRKVDLYDIFCVFLIHIEDRMSVEKFTNFIQFIFSTFIFNFFLIKRF